MHNAPRCACAKLPAASSDWTCYVSQGLAALLVKGLSGCAPEEIVSVEASSVIEALGLSASLTPSRNNGFLNMFRLMQKKALGFLTEVKFASAFTLGSVPYASQSALVSTRP